MEKLIELLNESEDGFVSKFVYYDELNRTFELDNGQSFHYTLILSKEYCFIKRLVENDKIELPDNISEFTGWSMIYRNCIPNKECDLEMRTNYVLMYLSIQDNPIEFLVSVLK